MKFEGYTLKETTHRVLLDEALMQFPASGLLIQVDGLKADAFTALDNKVNEGKIVYKDFGFYEEESGQIGLLTNLLNQLNDAVTEDERRIITDQIAEALSS